MKQHQCSVDERESVADLLRDLDERVRALGRQRGHVVERSVGRALSELEMMHVVSNDEYLDVEIHRSTLRHAADGETVDRFQLDKAVEVARAFLAKHPLTIVGERE